MIGTVLRVTFSLVFFGLLATVGWLGFLEVPENRVALLRDRAGGLKKEVLPAGRYWYLEKALPGRLELHLWKTRRQSVPLEFRRKLVEQAYMDLGPKFDIIIPLRATVQVDPAQATELFLTLEEETGSANLEEGLPALLNRRINPILYREYQRLTNPPGNPDLVRDQMFRFAEEELTARLKAATDALPVKIHRVKIDYNRSWQVPVLSQNEKQQLRRFDVYLQARQKTLLTQIRKRARLDLKEEEDKRLLENLKKLGPVIKKFPALKSYLTLKELGPRVKVILTPSGSFPGLDTLGGGLTEGEATAALPENQGKKPQAKKGDNTADTGGANNGQTMPDFEYKYE